MNEKGHPKRYPKLKKCGGLKLIHCIANCRVLQPLNYTVKTTFGQAESYIRPVQKNLSVISIPQDDKNGKNANRQKEFLLQDLRNHSDLCLPVISDYCGYDSNSTDNLSEVQN